MKIRKDNDFVLNWAINWNGVAEDFTGVTDIVITASVFGIVKTIPDTSYSIIGNIVRIEFTPEICNINGVYRLELKYSKQSPEFVDGERRSAVDVKAFKIVETSDNADTTHNLSSTSDAVAGFALKYEDLTAEQKEELRGKGITSIELSTQDGDTKTYTITYADGETFDFDVIDGHSPVFTFSGTVLLIDGVPQVDLKGETGNGIASIELTSTVGLVKTYTITFTDSTTTTFVVTDGSTPVLTFQGTTIYVNGVAGPNLKGETGKGISAVTLLSTTGLAKTYRITFTDSTTFDYVVTDGAAGVGAAVVQTTGASINDVMSQKAVTDELSAKANHGYESNPKTLKQVDDEVIQLAVEVTVKDAVHDNKIKNIENVISTMNPNQSAQLSVSGRKVVSLPKNASNGGMQVKLEGLTAENLVVNGDFRNGTTGWYTSYSLTVEDKILRVSNISGALPSTITDNSPIKSNTSGNKYYIKFRHRVLEQVSFTARLQSADATYLLTIRTIPSGVINEWVSTSLIVTPTTNLPLLLSFYSATSLTGGIFEIDRNHGVTIINLTATFGSGNEPDLATCDKMFSDYFEGVKSFEPTGRVRSVGKNLFNSTLEVGSLNDISGLPEYISSNGVRSKNFIGIIPNTQYSLSNNLEYLNLAYWYDSNENFISRTVSPPYISPINAAYMKIRTSTGGMQNDLAVKFQLEKASTATPYEPYRDTNLYLTTSELRSNGTVKDEIRKGANGYELVKRINDVDGTVLATPVISPIGYGGILNSAENGTVYHEPVIADAGVYGTNMPILLTDYPISALEEIIKHVNGVDTYINVANAVIAGDKLSFTHPDLGSGDLVLFTYSYAKESTNGNITATFYDSNVVKIDTVTGKAYKITDVVTNGVLTRTLTEV